MLRSNTQKINYKKRKKKKKKQMFCRHSKVQVRQNLRLTLNLNHHTKYPATTTTAKNAQTLKRRSHTTDDNAANATANAAQQTITRRCQSSCRRRCSRQRCCRRQAAEVPSTADTRIAAASVIVTPTSNDHGLRLFCGRHRTPRKPLSCAPQQAPPLRP